jgi:hypothetical protein
MQKLSKKHSLTEKGVKSMSEKLANPAPLGLLGFGITTVLLNLHNAGLYPLNSMILALGLVYGGLAQIIAGIMEYKKGNTFGTVAFTSYGLFWFWRFCPRRRARRCDLVLDHPRARRVGPAGEVHAFEPVPQIFQAMEKNLNKKNQYLN